MVYTPLAVRVALVAGFRRALPVFRLMIAVVVAVVMWESRRDFQGGWKAGFWAFHAFHTPAFPRLSFCRRLASSFRQGTKAGIGEAVSLPRSRCSLHPTDSVLLCPAKNIEARERRRSHRTRGHIQRSCDSD